MAEQKRDNTVKNLSQIKVDEHCKFNNVISTCTLTSEVLEEKISDLFVGVFDDFEGCKIVPVGNPGQPEALKCEVYFKPNFNKGDEGVYAVKVRGEHIQQKKQSTLADMVRDVNFLSMSKQFELEDIAKELLAEFLIIYDAKVVDRYSPELGKEVKVRLPKNWGNYIKEVTDVIAHTKFQHPYLVVTLDLVPLVAKLYGKKDSEEVKELAGRGIPKDRYQYAVNIVKTLNPSIRQYILEIRRIDIREINALSQSIGYGMVTGNIVMTRPGRR